MTLENEVPSEPTEEDLKMVREITKNYFAPVKKIARAISALRASWEMEKGELAENNGGQLTSYILRNWDREKLERFALHLLGEQYQNEKSELEKKVIATKEKWLNDFKFESHRWEAEKQALEAEKKGLESHLDDIYKAIGFSKNRCAQTGESPFDVINLMKQEKKGLEERVKEQEYFIGSLHNYDGDAKRLLEETVAENRRLKAENAELVPKDCLVITKDVYEELSGRYRGEAKKEQDLRVELVSQIQKRDDQIDSLTLALAEARERIKQLEDSLDVALKSGEVYKKEATNFAEKERDASNLLGIFKKSQIDFEKKIQDLNSLVSFMHSLIKFIHNDGKGREVFPNCELFSALEDLLNDPTSIRASEEMKALRKVVEAARLSNKECRKWRSNPDEKPCHEFKSLVDNDLLCHGCRLMNRIEALEAYESRGKV